MQSAFNKVVPKRLPASKVYSDETYDLRGLNLVAPDQITPNGESPYTINSRSYPREDDEKRVSIRTRKGSKFLSTPIGEIADADNTGTSTGVVAFDETLWVATSFTAESDGLLTKVEVEIKNPGSGGGQVIIEVYGDVAGVPNGFLSSSSFPSSLITSSFAYIGANFMDAPEIADGSTYWILVRIQELGTGSFDLNKTTGSGVQTIDAKVNFSPLGSSFRYKTYLSPDLEILGYARRYASTGTKQTIIASSQKLYQVSDVGVSTEIGTDEISADATFVRFAQSNDKLMWVDGNANPKWWDGTTVTEIANAPADASNIILYHNFLFFVTSDPNRVVFSDLFPDFETYDALSFFYVPTPKSPSPITGWCVFQDNLVIFTRETKYVVNIKGEGIGSITIQEAIGTKGALSQETIAVDRNGIYFMADDNQIYRWNGASDDLISAKIEPELNSISDKSKVRFHLYRNQLRVYYAKSPGLVTNRMLLFDIEQAQWFLDTGRSVMGSLEWSLDDNQLIEFSSRTGQMFTGESGFSDMGKAIDFKYWTNYKAYGSGAAKDRIKRFRPIIRPSNLDYYLMVGKDIDFQNRPDMRQILVSAGGTAWGGFVWGDGTIWGGGAEIVDTQVPMSGRGKFTQYRFENSGVETPCELYGYISLYKSGKLR